MRPRALRPTLSALCCIAIATAAAFDGVRATAHAATPTDADSSQPTTEDYTNALLQKVSLRIAPGADGTQPTVEYAVALICQQVGVPYQTERSRDLAGNMRAALQTPLAPVNLNGAVAATAIRAFCAKAGMAPQLDEKGVFLAPTPEEAKGASTATQLQDANRTSPPEHLSTLQRAQMGAAVNVTGKTSMKRERDTDRSTRGDEDDHDEYVEIRAETTRQHVQVEIQMISTKSLGQVKAVVTLYGRNHGSGGGFVAFHNETLHVGTLSRGVRRTGRSSVATTEYTETEYRTTRWEWRHGERRKERDRDSEESGTEYYAWIIDVYAGRHLIKSVTSNKALFHALGRDRRTGFPKSSRTRPFLTTGHG